jgi:hypothetical protein
MFGSGKLGLQSLTKSLFETILVVIFVSGCNLKKQAVEKPMENPENISKDFFVDPKTNVARTFIFGIQSENEVGWAGENYITHGMNFVDHANIVFDIQENDLIGKLVNPSFPDNPEKWEIAVTIPIISHYYYEKKKDDFGRETNEYIENTTRSHWSARPFLKLNLSGIQIHKYSYNPTWYELMVVSMKDIEWDTKSNFLGFTVTGQDKKYQSSMQANYRINFRAFEHNTNFKRTLFSDENYKYMNILHMMGQKYDGLKQMMYAARWDLEKSHEIVLHGFPNEETKQIAKDVIEDWNKTFESIGAVKSGFKLFVVNDKIVQKHAMDLRYNTIYWVDDRRISAYSPLGVGLASADLRNGEIIRGGITLWGGLIEEYLNGNLSPTANIETGFAKKIKTQFFDRLNMNSKTVKIPPYLVANRTRVSTTKIGTLIRDTLTSEFNSKNATLEKTKPNGGAPSSDPTFELNQLNRRIEDATSDFIGHAEMMLGNYQTDLDRALNGNSLMSLLGLDMISSATQTLPEEFKYAHKTSNQLSTEIRSSTKYKFDMDRTFADVAGDWSAALNQRTVGGKVQVNKETARRSLIKELISHEFGHFLGLGHQFKENILPEKGSVPDETYETLLKRSTPEAGMRQFTSVMGYRSPLSEFLTPYEEIIPGPHDHLSLRYLYKMEVSTFVKGQDKFNFHKITDGKIPSEINGEKVTYFPQCNDIEASYSLDPFCNRFDRGSNAKQIVQSYFNNLKDNLIQSYFAFSDQRKSDSYERDWSTWYRAMVNLGRVRLFYDYMRSKYKNFFETISNDAAALTDFALTCNGDAKNPIISDELEKNPELYDLCVANSNAIKGYAELISLPLSDYTRINIDNQFTPGGMDAGDIDRDYSKMFGTWTEAGAANLKMLAVYALKTTHPWMPWYGMWTVPTYDNPEHRYTYSALYPIDYTQAISESIRNNLKFRVQGDEKTIVGKAVLFAGLFSSLDWDSNDSQRFPKDYLLSIKKQTDFGFSIKALLVTKPQVNMNDVSVKSLKAEIYDMSSGQKESIPEVFILPDAYTIAFDDKSFVYPMSPLRFVSDKLAYLFAVQIDYISDDNSLISGHGAKKVLQDLHLAVIDSCLDGSRSKDGVQNGLRNFFNDRNDTFKGFYIPPTIHLEKEAFEKFKESITAGFDAYEKYGKFSENPPSRAHCAEAVRGVGLLVATAAIMQGFFTNELIEGLEK